MKTKICNGKLCKGKEKPLSEFHKNKNRKDGVAVWCKECYKEYQKINKEKITKNKKRWYKENKKFLKIKQKEYYDDNKDEILIKCKKYRDKNKEKINKQSKEWYSKNKTNLKEQRKNNKEEISKKNKEWRDKNKEKIKKHREQNKEYYKNYRKKWNRENKDKKAEINKKWQTENKENRAKYQRERAKTDINFRLRKNLRKRVWDALRGNIKSLSTMSLIGCEIDYLMYHIQEQFSLGMTWDNYGAWHIDHKLPCSSFDLSLPGEQRKCFNFKNLQPLWQIDNLRKGSKI